ncbi:BatA and WFA domain-containing protein [bacterium]|nr:BatA and WFA domain-containing protein [bacterium]
MDRFFLNPWMLAMAGLSAGIVLLYILRLKRKKVRISSTLLWERVIHDSKANAPWQKLRKNWLMILQIIALCLLALALARPFIFGSALLGARTVVVLDTSASMLAADEDPDRLGRAMIEAGKVMSDLRQSDEGMVIAAGPTPSLLCAFTNDKNRLQQAVRDARQYAGGQADINAALKLAASVSTGSAARVVIFSDGAVEDLDPFAVSDLKINYFPLGQDSENLGITGAGARRNPLTGQYELFVAMQSFFGTPQEADVTVQRQNGDVLDVRSVSFDPGDRQELLLQNLPYIAEPIKVELDFKDALKADNEAYVVMPRRAEYRVALCSEGKSFLLRKVLASLGDVLYYEYRDSKLVASNAAANASEESGAKIDVYIVEGGAQVPMDETASYLFLDTSSHPLLPVIPGAKVETDFSASPPVIPAVVGLDRSSPLLRYVNFSDLRLKAMRQAQLKPWGRSIVDATIGPLVVEGELNGQRSLYLAFDIYESDLTLRAAFPIFMANAVRYLSEQSQGAIGRSAQSGARVDLLAPPSTAEVEVSDPGGARSRLQLSSRDFTLSRTNQVGVYSLVYKDSAGAELGRQLVPVSLVSAEESNIAPAETLRVQGAEEALAGIGAGDKLEEITGTKQVRVNREFYLWLILAVLALITLEWWIYHTRAL